MKTAEITTGLASINYEIPELWKAIKGYEGLYEISNTGKIKSSYKEFRIYKEKLFLKQFTNDKGYLITQLSKNGIRKPYSIARLVAITFIPNPKNKPQVNHKNGNKLKNHASNLEWCTAKENVNHSISILGHSRKGEYNNNVKLTERHVSQIRYLYKIKKYNQKELAELYKVSSVYISQIILNKTRI